MKRSQKGLIILLAVVPALLVVSALLYMAGMERLEGQQRTFWQSLEFAGETLSTTGYGADARWRHPGMVIFVVVLQFIGVFLVFLIIPVYLVPFLEERFEERLPRNAPRTLRDHILVYHYGPAVETFIEQLRDAGKPFLVVETDETAARRLVDRRIPLIFNREEDEVLDGCRLLRAEVLVANARDEENAGVTLRARQMGFEGEIFAIVEEPMRRHALSIAGADAVYTPRHILAAALASRASAKISPQLAGIQQLSARLEVRELRIQATSPLVGVTLGESGITASIGAAVVAQWVGGRLIAPASPRMRLEKRGILVVVGTPEAVDRLAELASGTARLRRQGPFVVAGFGEVGRKVDELLSEVGEEVRTIDHQSHPGVDIVGNVLDPAVLRDSGVAEAQAVILALDRDDATLFAAMIVQDLAPDAPVIARVNHSRNVENIHRAGADFALSISQVSGQLLSQRILGQQSLSLDTHLRILRTTGEALQRARERSDCQVVAVERGSEVIVDPPPQFRFLPDDVGYVCGADHAVRTFR